VLLNPVMAACGDGAIAGEMAIALCLTTAGPQRVEWKLRQGNGALHDRLLNSRRI
jgi:hypothetical protein